jgi:3-deoxy-D-manno-octulosonate 8-phosphate phosphatase (KDO 8-P phosphatase)
MTYVRQDVHGKLKVFEELLAEAKVTAAECAFVGDDLPDIPVMVRVGLSVAVADSVEEAKQAAHYVTEHKGGRGAIREVIELILKAQGRWEELMERYQQ